ncbi:MAG: DUF4116 domain-containing protein [bacterium]
MDRQKLSIQLAMRALSVYEHDNPQKSDEVKNAQNTLGKALEYYFKRGYCSPDVPQQYRLLRGAEKERKKMFEKNFSKSEPEYREKNIRFFEVLEEKKEVSILQNYGYTDWYSLLQVETAEGEENAIPTPVFLNIIGYDVEKEEEDEYTNLLDRIFSSNGIKVKMIIDRFDEQHDNLHYPDFVGGVITDKNMLLKLLGTNDCYIGFSSQELRDDPEVMIKAIGKDHLSGRNFIYASPRLKKDKKFVLAICRLSEISVENIDSAILEDYAVVEALIKSDGDNFAKLPEKFREDKNLLLMALEEPVHSAEEQYLHASAELKNDREVVLKAVKSNSCWILEHVPAEFKTDAKVVMEACKIFSSSIQYASPELQNNRAFALKRAKVNAINSDTQTEKQWWDDEEIVLAIVKGWGHRLEYVSERLRSNKKIALEAVKSYPKAYRYVGEELKDDPDIKNIYEGALRKEKEAELTEEYLDHRSEALSLGDWKCLFLHKYYFLERTDCSHPKNDPNFCQLWILPEKTFDKIFDDRKKLEITIYGISKVRQNFEKAKRTLQLEEEATLGVKSEEIIEFHYTHSSSWGNYNKEIMFSIIPKE